MKQTWDGYFLVFASVKSIATVQLNLTNDHEVDDYSPGLRTLLT